MVPRLPRKYSELSPSYRDNRHSMAILTQFIGATDSAAPCAMLIDLAENITPLLRARMERLSNGQGVLKDGLDEEVLGETTLQIVFFDGEEAFHDWTDTDSIYGAR